MWRPVNLGRIPDLVVGPCDLSCLGRLRVRGAYPWAWRPTRSFVCRTLIAAGIDSVTPACRSVRLPRPRGNSAPNSSWRSCLHQGLSKTADTRWEAQLWRTTVGPRLERSPHVSRTPGRFQQTANRVPPSYRREQLNRQQIRTPLVPAHVLCGLRHRPRGLR